MAAFPPSAHAPKHAVAALGPELALILSLDMAAGAVQANGSKHATRKAVKVCIQALFLVAVALLAVRVCLKVLLRAIGLVKILIAGLFRSSCLFSHIVGGVPSHPHLITKKSVHS